ncbi:hypothetical protein ASE29_32805, partial [Ensifer sp. Root74]
MNCSALPERVFRPVELQDRFDRVDPHRIRRHRRHELQRRGDVHARAPDMRHDANAVQRRKARDLRHLGKAAAATEIRLQDVDGTAFDRRPHAIAAMPGLAAGNRDRLAGPDRAIGGKLSRRDNARRRSG